MRILLVASAFNSLTQRVHAELRDRGHTVAVELALRRRADAGRGAPPRARIWSSRRCCSTAIPEDVWSAHTCLIVHPGPPGDRGPVLARLGDPRGRRALGGDGAAGRGGDGRG